MYVVEHNTDLSFISSEVGGGDRQPPCLAGSAIVIQYCTLPRNTNKSISNLFDELFVF